MTQRRPAKADIDQLNRDREDMPDWSYQAFHFDEDGSIPVVGGMIPLKASTFGELFPANMRGKTLLDVGCQLGYWCFEAANRGARHVLGLDDGPNGSEQEEAGYRAPFTYVEVNTRAARLWPRYSSCSFEHFAFGSAEGLGQRFEPADIVMCCDMYHTAFRVALDHSALFLWLSQHVKTDGTLIWQNPVDTSGAEAQFGAGAVIAPEFHPRYCREEILAAASRYFSRIELVRESLHCRTRLLYRMSK